MMILEFTQNYLHSRSDEITLFRTLLNPIGETATIFSTKLYFSYIVKNHYLDGYLTILKLKSMILAEGIESENIPEFLKKHAETLYNPFTKKAINWDMERSMLFFVGPYTEDNNNQSEIKVNLEK